MGSPKALLATPSGLPLAQQQANLLHEAGCTKVAVVVGCDGPSVAEKLSGIAVVLNERWNTGRLSSVQEGLKKHPFSQGYLVLPVDAAGIQVETLTTLRAQAEEGDARVVRPTYKGSHGHTVWFNQTTAQHILEEPVTPTSRLDTLLEPWTTFIEVEDPAVLRNINTPEEWEAVKGTLH